MPSIYKPIDGAGFIRPYGDHVGDGKVQATFTLPLDAGPVAQWAALQMAHGMGLSEPRVVHQSRLTEGYTYFVVAGTYLAEIDVSEAKVVDSPMMRREEIDDFIVQQVGRPLVVVGAATGTDAHDLGIESILGAKGWDGHPGLEAYEMFETLNLGAQVPNATLVRKAIECSADAILVSQTVTQQTLHVDNLRELVSLVETAGLRRRCALVCGGAHFDDDIGRRLRFDACFSRGTRPEQVASFLAIEMASRIRVQDGTGA